MDSRSYKKRFKAIQKQKHDKWFKDVGLSRRVNSKRRLSYLYGSFAETKQAQLRLGKELRDEKRKANG